MKMNEPRFTTKFVITLGIAIATGVWGLSAEIRNRVISSDMVKVEAQVEAGKEDRSQIWRAIDKLVLVSENHQKTIDHIETEKHP